MMGGEGEDEDEVVVVVVEKEEEQKGGVWGRNRIGPSKRSVVPLAFLFIPSSDFLIRPFSSLIFSKIPTATTTT